MGEATWRAGGSHRGQTYEGVDQEFTEVINWIERNVNCRIPRDWAGRKKESLEIELQVGWES